jgi:hypothetical protein
LGPGINLSTTNPALHHRRGPLPVNRAFRRILLISATAGVLIGILSVLSEVPSLSQVVFLVLPLSAGAALIITLLDVVAGPVRRGRSPVLHAMLHFLLGVVAISVFALTTYFALLMTLLSWLGGA